MSDDGVRWECPDPPDGTSDEAWAEMRANELIRETAAVESKQRALHETNLWNSTLYCNRVLPGFNWGLEPQDHELFPSNLVTENLVLSIGEALLSKACSSPIAPTLVPRGSSFTTRRLVRRLTKWLQGTWKQLRCEELAVRAFLDAYISGKGVVDICHESDGLRAESIFFDDLIVDNTESAHRAPPSKYRVRYMVPIETVERAYGVELDDESESVKRGYPVEYRGTGSGWVPVVRAWCLPGPDGVGGRYTVATCGKILHDVPWDRPFPGILIFSWQEALSGFYGASGVETVVPYQITQNELNEVIRDVQDIASRPRLLAHAGSKFDQAQVDNVAARIWTYTGIEPKPFNWPTALADLYAERVRNKQECYGDFGISQMEAQASMPANYRYDSSAAVREAQVMTDRRFLRLWTAFEQFRLEMARRIIDVMATTPGAEHRTVWYAGGKAHAEEILWDQVRELTADHYTWSLEPVPASATTAAARRDAVEGRLMSGRLSPDEDRDIVREPDVEAIEDAAAASRDNIDWVVEEMEEGRYVPPDPFQNLTYGLPKVLGNALTLQTLKNVPARVMVFHQRWVRSALAIQNPQPMAESGPGLTEAPMGPGGPPGAIGPTPGAPVFDAPPTSAMAQIGGPQ